MKKITVSILLASLALNAWAGDVYSDSLEFVSGYATSPAEMLRGQIAGVRVGSYDGSVNGALTLNIRGVGALRTDAQPLYIVDGVQLSTVQSRNLSAFWQDIYKDRSYTTALNNLAFLNAYDIESIEVIKDMSAAAQYGARGANGVVIIKTKRATTKSLDVKWNSNFGFSPELKGLSHNHHISVSRLNDQTNYYLSGSFRRIAGEESAHGSTYGTLKAGFETNANRVVQFGLSSLLAVGKMNTLSTTNWFGAPSYSLAKQGIGMGNTTEDWVADYDDESKDYRSNTDVFLNLNFTRHLSLRTRAGLDFQGNDRYFWYGNRTQFGEDMNGASAQISTMVMSFNLTSSLDYSTFIGKFNKVEASLGGELLGDITKFNTMNGNDFFDHSLRARGINIAQSKDNLHNFSHNYSHYALFATVDYSYKGIFGLDGTFRPDFTPKYYSAVPQIYYGASGWVDVKKAFLSNLDAVSSLKIRAGYGVGGRESYLPYDLLGNYTSGSYLAVENGAEIYYDALNSVRSGEFNAAVEFGFLGGRITGSFGYYDKVSDDRLSLYCFGKKTGRYWDWASRQFVSEICSSLGNRGFEGTLEADIIKKEALRWRVSMNGAYNVNQMLSVDDPDLFGHEVGGGLRTNVNAIGHQAGSVYGFETDGAGNLVDQTSDGIIDDADYVVLGNPIPKFTGAINSDLSFGRWNAGVTLDGATGFDLVNLNKFVGVVGGLTITDEYVEKGDFLRLSRLSVSYGIPFNAKKGVKSIRLSLTGTNLFVLSGYSGWNPDVNSFSSCGFSRGLDYGSARAARSLILGVCVKF